MPLPRTPASRIKDKEAFRERSRAKGPHVIAPVTKLCCLRSSPAVDFKDNGGTGNAQELFHDGVSPGSVAAQDEGSVAHRQGGCRAFVIIS